MTQVPKVPECSTSYQQHENVAELNNRQIDRLRSVLTHNVEIHGRENFPSLEISLQDLIARVRKQILAAGLALTAVKLNGGAASYVLANEHFQYSDLDLIFPVALGSEEDFGKVRDAVFVALLSLMPTLTDTTNISAETLKDVYISKMVKVCSEEDRWSLFSLHNDFGKCIELKFVDRMRRQFEFSVDSFQITLDAMLEARTTARPVVFAESVFGDFRQALGHLNKRLIDTRHPEEIRGGGLLKYCHLITRGYRATPNCREMEKYMCSRFFIDFSDIQTQEMKLRAYLENHFGGEDQLQMKMEYLQVLHKTIKESTICLMGHERRQTLQMVDRLRSELEYGMMYSSLSVSCPSGAESTSGMSSPAPTSTASSEASGFSSSAVSPSPLGRSTLLYLPPNSNFWIPVV